MISKVLKIKNIGKFKNLGSTNDDLAFKEYTFIFGPNKHGKTTLTSIFKSLQTSETDYLAGRKTFGTEINDKQEYEILMGDNSKHTYNSGIKNENIEIFDNDFIHRNVFVGDIIDKGNKSSLYSILLDDKNIKLKEKVDLLEKKHIVITDERNNIKNTIKDFSAFILLEDKDKILDVDKKIKENDNLKKQFLNQAQLSTLSKKSKFNYDFDTLEEKLKQNIDTTLESKINDHIKNNHKSSTSSKNFLKDGISLITDNKNCPFCGQSLEDVTDHIEILKKFFSATYKEIQDNINDSIQSFSEIDIEKEVNAFKICGLEFENIKTEELVTHFSKIKEKLKEKQIDLSKDIKIEENLDYISFKTEVLKIKTELDKIKITTLDLQVLERESSKLNLNLQRFSVEGILKFNNYTLKDKELTDNKKSIDESILEIKKELHTLFSTHLGKINEVLTSSYANFKLKKLEPNTNRSLRDHMCEYSFVFDDSYDVNLDGENNVPNFKNTLSDSDKRVLAFAFFIAKINKEPNSLNKIVVFDDPFVSLDEDRRDLMIEIIKQLKVKQKIILSHSKNFIARFFLKIKKDGITDIATLKILKISGESKIKELTEDEVLLTEYDKKISNIRNATSLDIKNYFSDIRICIEHILKTKYKHLMTPNEIHLPMKFLDSSSCVIDTLIKNKISTNDYQEDHHDNENPPTEIELLQKRDDFINIILPKL